MRDEERGTSTQVDQITLNQNGFPLRGAQNDGTCFFVDKLVSDPEKKLSDSVTISTDPNLQDLFFIADSDEKTYFEDPVLSFEDSIIYGCKMELNLDELKDFCSKNLY